MKTIKRNKKAQRTPQTLGNPRSKDLSKGKRSNSSLPHTTVASNPASLKFSIRMGNFVTSISLKKNICSLWLMLSLPDDALLEEINAIDSKVYKETVLKFCHHSLNKWKENTAKGFSDFVTQMMLEDILDTVDYTKYKTIYTNL